MTLSFTFTEKVFVKVITCKQFWNVMMLSVFCFSNSYYRWGGFIELVYFSNWPL